MLLAGWSSDQTGERIWHTVIPRFLSAGALTVCFFSLGNVWLSVLMLSLATVGFYCAHPGFWPLPGILMRRSAAAASLGLINSCGNLGGFLGPYSIGLLTDRTGSFGAALLYLAACSLTSGWLVLGLRKAVRQATDPFQK